MPRLVSKAVRAALAASVLALSLGAFVRPAAALYGHADHASSQLALRQAMRKLWEDHITWTRLVIVSSVAGLPDLDATTQRLLQNQADIGAAVASYYGEPAGSRLTGLLREHIIGAADIIAAAKANDATKLEAAKSAWYANADTVATFLSGANPSAWPAADMRSMMREHLDLTLSEAVDQLQGRYAQSVTDYDKVHAEILQMADMLSDGIIRQFPKRF